MCGLTCTTYPVCQLLSMHLISTIGTKSSGTCCYVVYRSFVAHSLYLNYHYICIGEYIPYRCHALVEATIKSTGPCRYRRCPLTHYMVIWSPCWPTPPATAQLGRDNVSISNVRLSILNLVTMRANMISTTENNVGRFCKHRC